MKNAGQPDRDFDQPSRADATADAPAYPSSRRRLVEDQALERPAHVVRRQTTEQKTADPVGARLPHDIISEMEAALKQQVDRLVAKRH
ncbi:hypothetical protein [Bradyrhizobium sp. NAS96.2]|uniref:hypothetical protein n=1 Tax=Bradyrhizobium sp. NAS96.2 TaxID=1680160 RepID=UPI00116132BA|nr:hypothetical protein [Bradyrhizobium sp. NAS96.2]